MDAYRLEKIHAKDSDFTELSWEILKRGDSIRFKAHGSSMLPLIRDGDILTIKPIKIWDLKPGDVVFYQTAGEKCVVHRVITIDIRNDQHIVVFKGDSSPGSLEEVEEEQLLGRVVQLHRRGKSINPNRNMWWILSGYLPGFLHFSYLFNRIQKKLSLNRYWSD